MVNCEECSHYPICEIMSDQYGISKVYPSQCGYFQNSADVVPKSEVERLQIEIEALKIANEKMYSANKAQEAETAMEIIGIIDKRMEQKTEQCIGVRNEIVLGVYRGQLDAYRDVKEIIEQKYTEDQT